MHRSKLIVRRRRANLHTSRWSHDASSISSAVSSHATGFHRSREIMESISAIIFGLILMLPLLVQLQMFVMPPWQLLATLRSYLTESSPDVRCGERNLVVQYHPKLPDLLNSNSESRMMVVCPPRAILSSPAVPRVASADGHQRLVRKTIPLARHSSSFVATRIELPVVDITCNYNSYRYKTFEDSLRRRYGANYPPGAVVFNYIQLNTPDSRTGVEDDAGDDLLDLFDGNENAGAYSSSVFTKLETEYLNLLDHFILKQRERALTAGKFTETLSPDERNLEVTSRAGTWSQSTLRGSVAQEKGSGSSGNQRPIKGIECSQGGGANRRPNSSQRVLRRR